MGSDVNIQQLSIRSAVHHCVRDHSYDHYNITETVQAVNIDTGAAVGSNNTENWTEVAAQTQRPTMMITQHQHTTCPFTTQMSALDVLHGCIIMIITEAALYEQRSHDGK